MASSASATGITYLGQEEAQKVDEELMGPLGFSVDQLMELAGLACATSLASEYPAASHSRILIICGPGNNGGDGLVAARHLHHFGYTPQVCYPKRTNKPLYHGLVTQLESLHIPFVDAEQVLDGPLASQCDIVMDAMFGFGFKGPPRPPFDAILDRLRPAAKPPVLVAIDCPSGWHVESGDAAGDGLRPDMLISLTAPKRGARHFDGAHHYLGGRFVPPAIKERYDLHLPEYPGTAQCVRIGGGSPQQNSNQQPGDVAAMRINYDRGGLTEDQAHPDPYQQFDRWFEEAKGCDQIEEANAMALATSTDRGEPSVRYVLLKNIDKRGFSFYTNYGSRKAQEMLSTRHAALCFYWEPLQRSVRIEGPVEKLSDAESDAYFHSRPRGSQMGAIVSPQSTVLQRGREELEQRDRELHEKYADESVEIPRPQNWGGFLVRPQRIEFWHGRPSRLHDRLLYTTAGEGKPWQVQRLAP
ncbi:hypothetical protein WJX73_000581 [Symbiochloris irregularis]|uniref:NAD(P)H-hydrate epimerase n=1 Tax=Symbiochloris irregularis TaxID=706552 RepID=A0AAW1NZQ9_9CHLO